ncbi:MAG: GxxExxY protein [Anaerolineae bacterium]|nr:GxxExxY protein [Anaerolineae bacterium]
MKVTREAGLSEKDEQMARAIVDAAYAVHSALGPGLLESIYIDKTLCLGVFVV